MKNRAIWALIVSAALAAVVWALSVTFTGKSEPWDAEGPYYLIALAIAGAISGAVIPRHLGAHYIGAILGQAAYELVFLKLGPLFVLGLAFLAGYSIIFLGSAAILASFRKGSSTASPGSLAVTPHERGPRVRVNYAIVFVSDMKRAVLFYRDVIGLPLKFESPGWAEFATDGATLALHAGEKVNPERDDPQANPAGRCRPGLSVQNLDEFHKRMLERAVPCIQEPKETFGVRIAQYVDPDGLVISISESRGG